MANKNSESGGPRRDRGHRGRRPGPRRVVIQMRVRECGKVSNYWSFTVNEEPSAVMKKLQEMFDETRIRN